MKARRPALVGILGGMGPAATADFYRKMIEATPATRDQDHIQVVMWADPTTPDRTAFLAGTGTSPLPHMLAGVAWLAATGAQVIAIPCNTAHAYLRELRSSTEVEILDMVDLAVRATQVTAPPVTPIGVLATRGTHLAQLYQSAAMQHGIRVVIPDDTSQSEHVDRAIAMVKSGRDFGKAEKLVERAAARLKEQGAEILISGCTEIPLVAGRARRILPIIDATEQLAIEVVNRAGTSNADSTFCRTAAS